MLTHFTKDVLAAARVALAAGLPFDEKVNTPDGYERLCVVRVPHTAKTDMSEHYWPPEVTALLQYWRCHGHITVFKNYTTFEEWEART